MVDKAPSDCGDEIVEPPSLDMGALARSLRPAPNTGQVVLWWAISAVVIGACAHPNAVTLSALWLYVTVLVLDRWNRRRTFLRNLAGLPRLSRDSPVHPLERWPNVAVFVPARDEEKSLDHAARSLTSLTYPNLEIWFINDHSSDRTRGILDAIQRDYPHVHVLHDPPVVDGWFGKSNALWQAFLQSNRGHDHSITDGSSRWLLFADADVEFEPEILEQAVAVAERDRLDFLTCMPCLVTKTWAEQLLLPTGWRGLVEGAHYDRLNKPNTFPIGIGAFMLIRETSYRAFGGHQALGKWHPEDTLMAAAVKKAGGRVGFAWTPDLLRVRFYYGYGEVKKHTLRKMRIFFGEHIQLPLTMIALRLSTMLIALPMVAVGVFMQLDSGQFSIVPALLAAAGLVLYVNEALEYRGIESIADFHPAVPWLSPISGVLRVWFALSLIGQILANKPMEWRGRREFGTAGGDVSATPDA